MPPHSRKISYHDMAMTYHNAGPIAPPPQPPGPGAGAAPQMSHAQMMEQHRQEQARRNHALRTSRKPTDREIPDELADVIVGDGVAQYNKLRGVERRVDAAMMRKRLDIKDNAQRPYSRREGVLRVWISNTADGQPWQLAEDGDGMNADGTFDFGDDSNAATWRVRMDGRLLPEVGTAKDEEESTEEAAAAAQPKLSSFFRSITVDLHRNPALHPDGYSQIEWRKQQASAQTPNVDPSSRENSFNRLEFQRKGDENINVTINMVRDPKNERYRVSPALAFVLGEDEEDMPGAVQGIWEYARAMNLQEDEDKRTITCDEELRRLFNQEKISFPYLPDLLQPHLQPLPPIKLAYTIRVDKAYISPTDGSTAGSRPTIYDVRVPLPNPLAGVYARFQSSKTHVATLSRIVQVDDDLALLVAKINQTNAKRKFFENLAKDPAGFVQRWSSSQKRDLEVILADATRGGGGEDGEQWRKGGAHGVWGSEAARESVGLWLARSGKH